MKSTEFLLLLLLLFSVASCDKSNKNNNDILGRKNSGGSTQSSSGTEVNPPSNGLPLGTGTNSPVVVEKHESLNFRKDCIINVTKIDLSNSKITISDDQGNENTVIVNKINNDDESARTNIANGVQVGKLTDSSGSSKDVYAILSKISETSWAKGKFGSSDGLVVRFVAEGLSPEREFDVAAELKVGPLKLKYESNKFFL